MQASPSEPPHPSQSQGLSPENSPNPYAPPSDQPGESDYQGLPIGYWIGLMCSLPVLGWLCYAAPGIGIPVLFTTLAAAVRVPLMARLASRSSRPRRTVRLFLASWCVCLLLGVASFIAFCCICLPVGAFFFTLHGPNLFMVPLVSVSGFVALFVFIFLFQRSLKLPY